MTISHLGAQFPCPWPVKGTVLLGVGNPDPEQECHQSALRVGLVVLDTGAQASSPSSAAFSELRHLCGEGAVARAGLKGLDLKGPGSPVHFPHLRSGQSCITRTL
jgi:hypothetical protein